MRYHAISSFDASDCNGLPYETYLKVGCQYFVSTNVDVEDGLFNGSTGVLKMIERGQSSTRGLIPTKAWMDFNSSLVGSKARAITKQHQIKNNIDLSWVRISRIQRLLNLGPRETGINLVRTQIPLVAANGMTIHKSQGSTLPCAVICVRGASGKKLSRDLLYVGCSRVSTLSGLFIDGKFEKPSAPGSRDLVTKEMDRLRHLGFEFQQQFLQDINDGSVKIYFHNVQSLRLHHLDVICDECPMSADFLCFVEPHMQCDDSVQISNFKAVHQSKGIVERRTSRGSIVYARSTQDTTRIVFSEYTSESANGHCLCATWKQYNTNFVMTYRSPRCSMAVFIAHLAGVLNKLVGNVVLFGDFNIESRIDRSSFFVLMDRFKLLSKLDLNEATTYDNTTIDFCFSNSDKVSAFLYETHYSHHKAICILLQTF